MMNNNITITTWVHIRWHLIPNFIPPLCQRGIIRRVVSGNVKRHFLYIIMVAIYDIIYVHTIIIVTIVISYL